MILTVRAMGNILLHHMGRTRSPVYSQLKNTVKLDAKSDGPVICSKLFDSGNLTILYFCNLALQS